MIIFHNSDPISSILMILFPSDSKLQDRFPIAGSLSYVATSVSPESSSSSFNVVFKNVKG